MSWDVTSCTLLHGYQHSEGKMPPSSFKCIISLTGRWRQQAPTIITHQTTWCCIPVGCTVFQSDLSEQNIEGGMYVLYPLLSPLEIKSLHLCTEGANLPYFSNASICRLTPARKNMYGTAIFNIYSEPNAYIWLHHKIHNYHTMLVMSMLHFPSYKVLVRS